MKRGEPEQNVLYEQFSSQSDVSRAQRQRDILSRTSSTLNKLYLFTTAKLQREFQPREAERNRGRPFDINMLTGI